MGHCTEERLWDVEEVARFLHVPVNAIYGMTRRDTRNPIPHIKVGNRLRFRRSDIEQWLDLLTNSPLDHLTTATNKATRYED